MNVSALSWLRGTIEVHDEMDEMRSEYESIKLVPAVSLKELIMNASLRIPLTIAVMIMIAQQLSGINAIMFFSTKIFTMAGLDDHASQMATLGVGTMNVIMTIVSLFLVERAGRKTLLLIGFAGMVVVTFLLAVFLPEAVSLFSNAFFKFTLFTGITVCPLFYQNLFSLLIFFVKLPRAPEILCFLLFSPLFQ